MLRGLFALQQKRYNTTPRNLEQYELDFLSTELTQQNCNSLSADLRRNIYASHILGEQLSNEKIEGLSNKMIDQISYKEHVDALISIMQGKGVPNENIQYFAHLMVHSRIQIYQALPWNTILASLENCNFYSSNPTRTIKLVENEGKYNVEYTMTLPILVLENVAKPPIANIELKYTFSQDRTIQLSMGIDNPKYEKLCKQLFDAVKSTRYFNPKEINDPYSLLGFGTVQSTLKTQQKLVAVSQAKEEKESKQEAKASLTEKAKEEKESKQEAIREPEVNPTEKAKKQPTTEVKVEDTQVKGQPEVEAKQEAIREPEVNPTEKAKEAKGQPEVEAKASLTEKAKEEPEVAEVKVEDTQVKGQPEVEAKASQAPAVQEAKGKLTEQLEKLLVVERIEKGLQSIGETQITKLARSIDRYGEKNNFKDAVFKTENSDIYNALSDKSKAKIDKIGEKLSDNRNALRKIIDYLKLIFCKTLDRQTVEGLNAKPTDDEKREIEGRKSFVEQELERRKNSSQQISR